VYLSIFNAIWCLFTHSAKRKTNTTRTEPQTLSEPKKIKPEEHLVSPSSSFVLPLPQTRSSFLLPLEFRGRGQGLPYAACVYTNMPRSWRYKKERVGGAQLLYWISRIIWLRFIRFLVLVLGFRTPRRGCYFLTLRLGWLKIKTNIGKHREVVGRGTGRRCWSRHLISDRWKNPLVGWGNVICFAWPFS